MSYYARLLSFIQGFLNSGIYIFLKCDRHRAGLVSTLSSPRYSSSSFNARTLGSLGMGPGCQFASRVEKCELELSQSFRDIPKALMRKAASDFLYLSPGSFQRGRRDETRPPQPRQRPSPSSASASFLTVTAQSAFAASTSDERISGSNANALA